MTPQKRREECPWCNKGGGKIKRTDANGNEFMFHKECWKAHCEWIWRLK